MWASFSQRNYIYMMCRFSIYIYSYREIQPFQRHSTNKLAYIAQYGLFVTFGSALVIASNIQEGLSNLAIGLILCGVNLVVVFFAVSLAVASYYGEKSQRTVEETRHAYKVENSCSFDEATMKKRLDEIADQFVSPSQCMVFVYCSISEAQQALKSGIPAIQSFSFNGGDDDDDDDAGGDKNTGKVSIPEGVLVTLHAPYEVDNIDRKVFSSFEAVLVCSLSRSFFDAFTLVDVPPMMEEPSSVANSSSSSSSSSQDMNDTVMMTGEKVFFYHEEQQQQIKNTETLERKSGSLCVISGKVLRAVRWFDSAAWVRGDVLLPPQLIIRAYQLVDQSRLLKTTMMTIEEEKMPYYYGRASRTKSTYYSPEGSSGRDKSSSLSIKTSEYCDTEEDADDVKKRHTFDRYQQMSSLRDWPFILPDEMKRKFTIFQEEDTDNATDKENSNGRKQRSKSRSSQRNSSSRKSSIGDAFNKLSLSRNRKASMDLPPSFSTSDIYRQQQTYHSNNNNNRGVGGGQDETTVNPSLFSVNSLLAHRSRCESIPEANNMSKSPTTTTEIELVAVTTTTTTTTTNSTSTQRTARNSSVGSRYSKRGSTITAGGGGGNSMIINNEFLRIPWDRFLITPRSCLQYVNHMSDIRRVCDEEGWCCVYHYTQPFLGPMIYETGFRMSTQGQGDGGVYFSTLGPASYDLGTPDYEKNIIVVRQRKRKRKKENISQML
jgi:hypothetical protein